MSGSPVDTAFVVEDLGIVYNLERSSRRSLHEEIGHMLRTRRLRRSTPYWAIRDVSFTLGAGETLGVVGRNGSGKSTLLLALASILLPDEGTVHCYGRPVLATIGAGFNNELTGRQNVYLNGAYLGFSTEKIDEMIDPIVEFSELGDFIDVPLRQYSTGMRSRLAFSIGSYARPDILLLDEVLGGGDPGFRDKASARMQEMMESARAMVVVSHSIPMMRELATKVLWLDRGGTKAFGDAEDVLDAYQASLDRVRKAGPLRAIA